VYITGTFNNWERQIPMHRSGNDFTYVHNLPKGKHAYKFIVDDEWRFAPDQPTIADVEGRINNFIDITEFVPYTGDDHFFEKSKERKIPDEEFRQVVPDLDDYTKE
jgi:5'-AMP-activated protein kinase regulatory beta subunit